VVKSNHFFLPRQVAIAVEVVSPGTKRRDRFEKPVDYALAGVAHFWRIEQDPVHVFAYDLVAGEYELVADSGTELTLSAPFEIKLPIREITP
jgi:Uma2 family endonuclease